MPSSARITPCICCCTCSSFIASLTHCCCCVCLHPCVQVPAQTFPLRMRVMADPGKTLNTTVMLDKMIRNAPDLVALIGDFVYAGEWTNRCFCIPQTDLLCTEDMTAAYTGSCWTLNASKPLHRVCTRAPYAPALNWALAALNVPGCADYCCHVCPTRFLTSCRWMEGLQQPPRHKRLCLLT
jgi:hypothetical protein